MNIKIKLNKFLFGLMLICGVLLQCCSYIGAEYVELNNSGHFSQLGINNWITLSIKILFLLSIFLLFISEFVQTVKQINKLILILQLFLVVGVIFWTIDAILEGKSVLDLLYESTPPYVYLTALVMCVGLNNDLWNMFIKWSKIIGFIFLIFAFLSYLAFIIDYPNGYPSNSSVLTFFVQSFWLLVVVSLFDKKPFKIQWLLIIFVCLWFSLLFTSRSWAIQVLAWLFLYLYYKDKKRGLVRYIKIIFASIIFGIIAFLIINKISPQFIENLVSKLKIDTRSFQYIDIFSQTSFWDFIFGKGYNFQYVSDTMGGLYSYIDNAYLLMLIRYGLVIGLVYPLLFIIPMIGAFKAKTIQNKYSIIILMWLLALGGLSIFCVTILDIKSIALPIVTGRCIWETTQKQKEVNFV